MLLNASIKVRKNRRRCNIAFRADSREQVDAFWQAALAAGGKDNGAPGLRPNYHASYYAAFVIAPDGHNIEAVCHLAG
ncbi:Lactoylglutathione lyase and related lyases [Klebsiella pneumoniae IS46]|nr:Lactoylglutathione lyase and related lyases [Klebsiella pneumoniae IS46]